MIKPDYALYCLITKLKSPKDALLITTTQLGEMWGVSQQTASRYLRWLESEGWINRKRSGKKLELRVTPKGILLLTERATALCRFLSYEKGIELEGTIVSGIGEGAYYIKEYASRLQKVLGYMPFFGTLNVRFEGGRPELSAYKSHILEPFVSGGRSFGKVEIVPIILKLQGHTIKCHAIIPERTHHKMDLEIVAKYNIRKKYNLKDGDKVTIKVS